MHGVGKYDYAEAVYVTAHVKLLITCVEHGAFAQTANSHLRGKGCPVCGHIQRSESQLYDTDWFVGQAKTLHGKNYDYSRSKYLGRFAEITIGCYQHGNFTQSAGSHLGGTGCPACWQDRRSDARQVSMEDFIARAHAVHGGGRYDYKSVKLGRMIAPVVIDCPSHGPFHQRPHKHLLGDGCPACSESRGEKEIRNALTTMGVDFESQWTHSQLRLHRPLYFDFAIPDRKIAIEFDGEQHRRPVRFRGISQERAERQFDLIKQRDAIKDTWANDMGWTLIRLTNTKSVVDDLGKALE